MLSQDRRTFLFMPDRAEIVQRVFKLSIAGVGSYAIAKIFNETNVPAFGTSGRWDASTIDNMLRSRATLGEHQPKDYRAGKECPIGPPIADYYPAVIDEALFVAAQEARRKNLDVGRGRKGPAITNLFADLPRCAYCSSPVKFYSNGNAKSLVCSKLLKGRLIPAGQRCYRKAWSCPDFEASLFRFVLTDGKRLRGEDKGAELSELISRINGLAEGNLYEARLALQIALRQSITDLVIGAAGMSPIMEAPTARVHRDAPGRYFEVSFFGGPKCRAFGRDRFS
jgi:Recombinase